jgi:uncharacterized protein (DUF1697 family)
MTPSTPRSPPRSRPDVPRYAAFLRALNVGARRASKEQLTDCLEGIGFDDVATFRTSGNVVFGSDGPAGGIAAKLEEGLRQALGFEVPIYLRSERQIRAIAAYDPFEPELVEASKGKLQVVLLERKPTAAERKAVLALATDDDRLAMRGTELYWLPSGGTLKSALDHKAITKALGPTTHRTKGTMDLIASKFFGG